MHLGRALTLTWAWAASASALPREHKRAPEPSCRFALGYSQQEVVQNPSSFIQDMLYWEAKFHQNNVSYNSQNGMSYDGTNINYTTGERTEKHGFSAASKEVSLDALL